MLASSSRAGTRTEILRQSLRPVWATKARGLRKQAKFSAAVPASPSAISATAA